MIVVAAELARPDVAPGARTAVDIENAIAAIRRARGKFLRTVTATVAAAGAAVLPAVAGVLFALAGEVAADGRRYAPGADPRGIARCIDGARIAVIARIARENCYRARGITIACTGVALVAGACDRCASGADAARIARFTVGAQVPVVASYPRVRCHRARGRAVALPVVALVVAAHN